MMDFDSLFAGIEPGGMTDVYEIKILICYLLHAVKEPLSKEQMDMVLQGNHLVNYFSYSSAYQELLKSGHISLAEQNGREVVVLNKFGRDTALLLKSSLPLSVKDKVVSAGMEILAEMRRDRERETRLEEIENGYIVRLILHDGDLELLNIGLFAPDMEQADIIRNQFMENTADIYKGIISLLIRDKHGLELIAKRFGQDESETQN